ncbi:MAG TPA: polysaccharide biosynthesis tyrosine autokinase [Longimicrobiales bacterium]|nr:polysaccharide biosynthesis tyrosine autokinase [Longimicrobiales bacterium]
MTSKNPVPYDPYGGPSDLGAYRAPGAPAYGGPGGGMSRGPQEPAGPTTGIVQRTLTALYRFKWMILAILVLGVGAAYAAIQFQEPVYETRARVWFGAAMVGSGPTGPIRQGTLLDNAGWQSLLRSSTVLDSVIFNRRMFIQTANAADSLAFEAFGVNEARLVPGVYRLDWDENGRGFVLLDDRGNRIQSGAWGDSVGPAVGFQWVPASARVPRGRSLEFRILSPGDVRNQLATDLRLSNPAVGGRTDETFLNISLRGPDRQQIAATLVTVIDRFERVALELKTERLAAQTAILKEQLDAAELQLGLRESALQSFQIQTATSPTEARGTGVPVAAGLQQTTQSVFGTYFTLSTQKDELAQDRQAIARALDNHTGDFALVTALEVIGSVGSNSSLNRAIQEAADAEAQRRALEVTLTPLNPQVARQTEYRDSLLQSVIPGLARTLMNEMGARDAQIETQMTSVATELREIPARSIQEGQLQRQVAIADQLYRQLENNYQASKLAEVIQVADMQVLDEPNVPYAPVSDTRRDLFLMIVAGAFGLALALAVLRDRVDPRVQYPDQVTGGMGLTILGAVPALRGGRLGSGDMALAVEAFRSIQLSLTHAAADGGPIMVTFSSPGASDGKSFVTSNLAIAFADMGHRTLVIDGDVRRGTMHKLLGVTHKPGLTDYLGGRTDRKTMIQETRYPLLHFIGCGSRQDSGPKLLGSPAMRNLMRDLRTEYDVILVDSPPLGACVDPMILATLTRNLVLVVRSGSTDRTLAESKLDALDRLPVRVLGAVLNDVTQGGPYRYYSYVSGYEVIDDAETRALTSESDAEAPRATGDRPAATIGED